MRKFSRYRRSSKNGIRSTWSKSLVFQECVMKSNTLRRKATLMINYEGPALVLDGKHSACRDISPPTASFYFSNKDLPLWMKMMSAHSHRFYCIQFIIFELKHPYFECIGRIMIFPTYYISTSIVIYHRTPHVWVFLLRNHAVCDINHSSVGPK